MKLSPPKMITFWIAVALVVIGIIATFVTIPFLSTIAFWIVVLGFVLLLLGNLISGL